MRVLVLATTTAGLRPQQAGSLVGAAWARRGHAVAVVPMAEGGDALADAVADLGRDVAVARDPLGLRDAVLEGYGTVLVDLTEDPRAGEAGRGFVDVLGADLASAQAALGGTTLVGIIRPADESALVLGVQGVAARAGYARSADIAEVLAADARYARIATEWGISDPPPGSGAAEGAALAVLALGGRLAPAPSVLADLVGLASTIARCDLVVVVCPALDFGGHGVVITGAASSWAAASMRPCIAIAEHVYISNRELRAFGLEAAYGLPSGASTGAEAVAALADSVATTWSW